MKRFLPLLLLGSMALNAAFGSLLLQRPAADIGASAPSATPGSRSAAFHAPTAAPELDVSPASKPAALAAIEMRAFDDLRLAAPNYWRTDGRYELEYGRAVREAEAHVRAELIGLYGEAARADPVFRRVFRPLDPVYAFLSSEQQLAVQQLRFERDAAFRESRGRARGSDASTIAQDAVQRAAERYRAGLAELLDEPTLFEFELRESPLAEQLRASGIDLNEDEFRASFGALLRLEDPAAAVDAVLAAREALRDILGDRRAAAFWASRDPLFARLESVTESHGLNRQSADAVYGVIVDFQDRRLKAASSADVRPEQAGREMRLLGEEERRAIARLVGDDVADEILSARAVGSFRLLDGGGDSRAR